MQDTPQAGPPEPGHQGPTEELLRDIRETLADLREVANEIGRGAPRKDALLTYDEAAVLLGVSRRKIQRYVSSGDLPCIDLDGSVRIAPAALDAFLRRKVRR